MTLVDAGKEGSDIIRLVERLGRMPARGTRAAGAAPATLVSKLASKLDPAARRAVLDGDAATLAGLAGARGEMRCLILTPDR